MAVPDSSRHVVIVGASLAGTRTAQGLRALGFPGRITLLGAEDELPYDRPPLSKDLLRSDWSDEAVAANRLLTEDELAELDLDLRLGVAATGLDPSTRTVTLSDSTEIGYDVLVIATGASARPSPWRPASGVLQLRTLADARAIGAALARKEPIVVVGGGFIGTEIAAAAIRAGCPVTVVDPVPEPMARLVGPEIARELVDLHERHGAATRFGVGVSAIEGEQGDLRVVLADGSELRASTAVVGIGSVPSTGWLAGSGLSLENGVRTDDGLRAFGAEDVYAIGDVAQWPHSGRGSDHRAEHWTNASDQARYVASAITGVATGPYTSNDYVWSDQYDWKVHSIGWRDPDGSSSVVGDLATDGRVAVIHADAAGVALGAVTVNWVRVLNQVRRGIASGTAAEDIVAGLRQSV
ncbi:FAD-dependent oxidoreductase [Rathayibacter sp. VKM Ac-2835]|uniref:NAD(P)/FAD-dependent oxidoreductase n=1 Tax=Rathayibacter sp. VKM Ac-2835 TaxID=2739043 RepID=UPI0015637161|nr:FAD-dependent oxidoreductase [Rathayibacter sp. VKM Ac-2835]NRG41042.1 FAD-dependent oxidoreductase [Rathayibacter sp. VKM Ac-2835]